jgi:DNA repair exonuclease SbcCD ATPase subunit
MKIERLYIYGFGKLINKLIEFDPANVNLLIEENEFGKSTIAVALTAALYGFPPRQHSTAERLSEKESFRPLSGDAYKVGIDLDVQGNQHRVRLRIVRDFDRGEARVFNLSEGDTEITDQFIQQKGEPTIGPKLLNLSREQFINTCYVWQGALEDLTDLSLLTTQLQQIADSESGQRTAADAIGALEAAMDKFPGSRMGKGALQIANEIKRAQEGLSRIEGELQALEARREAIRPELSRIDQLKQQIEEAERRRLAALYLHARAELDDVDGTLKTRRELQEQARALEAELKRLEAYQAFPAAQQSNLDQWRGELTRLNNAAKQKEADLRQAQRELENINQPLDYLSTLNVFTKDDYEALIRIASAYDAAQEKWLSTEEALKTASRELNEKGMTIDEFEKLDEPLRSLTPAQRQEAADYIQRVRLLQSERERHQDKAAQQAASVKRIDRERKQKQSQAQRLFIAAVLGVVIAVVFFFIHQPIGALVSIIGAFLASSLGLHLRQAAKNHRAGELTRAEIELNQEQQEAQKIQDELQANESHMLTLAQLVGVQSTETLAQACKRYNQMSGEVQPALNLRARWGELKEEVNRITRAVDSIFEKARRDSSDISRSTIEGLRRDLKRFLDLTQEREQVEKRISALQGDVENLGHEAVECTARIRQLLRTAHLSEYDHLDQGIEQFREGVEKYNRLRHIQADPLPRVQKALREAASQEELEARRERIQHRIRALEQQNPNLSSLSPAQEQDYRVADPDHYQRFINAAREEISRITQQIAADLKEMETRRPDLLAQQYELSEHLRRVLAFKDAVELAKATFERIAKEIHRQWADSLTELSRQLLDSLSTDYAALRFDPNLSFTVSVKGQPEPLQSNQVRSQLSMGAREQLVLLSRLVVSRYLSKGGIRLPLILDEPFAGADDERFAQLMELILHQLSREHQVIIFSCHHQRHEWLSAKWPDQFTERVHQCRLVDLKPAESQKSLSVAETASGQDS